MPTGGPRDRTPPAVAASTPAAGATNVEAEELRIQFSEYVDQNAFARAFSITPPFDGRLAFNWSGRTVTIEFPTPLQENTTYLITFDTNLRDYHGVQLNQPITLAFSTGPEINKGRLAGRVLDAMRGTGLAEYDIYAYPVSDTLPPAVLPEQPYYRTQTGSDGRFLLEYLNEQPYYVIALRDRNRNRQPDPLEPFAVPPRPILVADTTGDETAHPWLSAVLDTLPPEPQRVRPLSDQRLEVYFSEDVLLTTRSPKAWRLRDSLQSATVPIRSVYTRADVSRVVFLRTDSLHPSSYVLTPGAVVDTSGNATLQTSLVFAPESFPPDTLRPRFTGFLPEGAAAPATSSLRPDQAFGVRFNQPLDSTLLRSAVAVRDTMSQARSFTARTDDGTSYRLSLSPPLQPEMPVTVAVNANTLSGQDTTYTRTFARLSEQELGGLSGYIAVPDTAGTSVIELYSTDRPAAQPPLATTQPDSTGRFAFTDLPEGRYRFRAFLDRNANTRWDPGRLAPYEGAEPVTWSPDTLRVRPRWDSELADTLHLEARP